MKNVLCAYSTVYSGLLDRNTFRCLADQKIESADYSVEIEPTETSVENFRINQNIYVKFLPKNIGEKFPNLMEFDVSECALSGVRNFYFKNMRNLKFLILMKNKIATIESDAFKDLVSVEALFIDNNMIQTLDKNLFASMKSLSTLFLSMNKIKFMSPTTFKISGGSLVFVDLRENVCIGSSYRLSSNLNDLESDIYASCSEN